MNGNKEHRPNGAAAEGGRPIEGAAEGGTSVYIFHIYSLNFFHIFSLMGFLFYGVKSRSGHDRSQSFASISHISDPKLIFEVIS